MIGCKRLWRSLRYLKFHEGPVHLFSPCAIALRASASSRFSTCQVASDVELAVVRTRIVKPVEPRPARHRLPCASSRFAFQPPHPSPLADLPPLSIATRPMQVNACTQRGSTYCFLCVRSMSAANRFENGSLVPGGMKRNISASCAAFVSGEHARLPSH